MQYSILIFNRKNLGSIAEDSLINAITQSNYETLCDQYGLEPSLIEPALSNLDVVVAKNSDLPLFVVKYGESHGQAVVVQQWDADSDGGKNFLERVIEGITLPSLRSQLLETRWIVEVALTPVQLKGIGLLLAYEIARWAADRGKGIVYALDGAWYRLNPHKAFIPINSYGN